MRTELALGTPGPTPLPTPAESSRQRMTPGWVALGAWEDGANASGGADGGSVNAVLISFHILIQKLLTIELRLYKIRD